MLPATTAIKFLPTIMGRQMDVRQPNGIGWSQLPDINFLGSCVRLQYMVKIMPIYIYIYIKLNMVAVSSHSVAQSRTSRTSRTKGQSLIFKDSSKPLLIVPLAAGNQGLQLHYSDNNNSILYASIATMSLL